MKKNLIYFATVILLALAIVFLYTKDDKGATSTTEMTIEKAPGEVFKSMVFNSSDSLRIHADLYEVAQNDAPIIILFHQARYSRGEYISIAPKLNELGFMCMAVDQRSGKEVHGVENETHQQAVSKGKAVAYPDAYPDLEASLEYVKQNFPNRSIIVWGSSYSAALSFILTQKHPEDIDAIVAFSPGNYFEFEGKDISAYANEVTCPVFITSAGGEGENWKPIFESLPNDSKRSYLPDFDGKHGSSALLENTEGYEKYWKELKSFLSGLK